jgi:hypothetical protein
MVMPNLGVGAAHMSARLLAKDIIPDGACIGALGQSLEAAPPGERVVENLRQVAFPDKEPVALSKCAREQSRASARRLRQ